MNLHLPANSYSNTLQDSITLCLTCGFCCNGILHTYTKVAASEAETLQRLGTPLYASQSGYEFAFAQPCPHWQENRCAIYSHRPKSCRTYECRLFKKLAAGLITPADSLQHLQKAQKLLAQRDTPALASEKDQHAALLRSFLRRHFEPEQTLYQGLKP